MRSVLGITELSIVYDQPSPSRFVNRSGSAGRMHQPSRRNQVAEPFGFLIGLVWGMPRFAACPGDRSPGRFGMMQANAKHFLRPRVNLN